jgi:hypothetical protein
MVHHTGHAIKHCPARRRCATRTLRVRSAQSKHPEGTVPSFDVVSEIDLHELTNAVDQTNREVTNRFDFKGSGAKVTQAGHELTLVAQTEFQVQQMRDILITRIAKRGIDTACLDMAEVQVHGSETRQIVTARHGIDKELGKEVQKVIKDSKLKVQAAIQGDQVRVTGKQRDDLQDVIALLRKNTFALPLQYTNFRD